MTTFYFVRHAATDFIGKLIKECDAAVAEDARHAAAANASVR